MFSGELVYLLHFVNGKVKVYFLFYFFSDISSTVVFVFSLFYLLDSLSIKDINQEFIVYTIFEST